MLKKNLMRKGGVAEVSFNDRAIDAIDAIKNLNDIFDLKKGESNKMKSKNLFISTPMQGLFWNEVEEIRNAMSKIANAYFNVELSILDSHVDYSTECDKFGAKNYQLFCLGESIKIMSKADLYIGIIDDFNYHGCAIENLAAKAYGIPSVFIQSDDVLPGRLKHVAIYDNTHTLLRSVILK